jgi:HEAT repeat protein
LIIWLTVCAGVLAGAGWASVSTLAVRRLLLARADRRRLELESRLRPVALALLEGDTVDLNALENDEVDVLVALVGRFGRMLQGSSKARLATFFERQGEVHRQLSILESSRQWRRAAAAFALGDMASPRSIPALRVALDDPDREVRSAAARSLGRLGDPSAVEPLVRAVGEGSIPRSVGGHALLLIGEPALPVLRALVKAPEAEERALAVDLVGFLGDASDGPRLMERLRDSSAEVRARAARALGRLGAEEGTAELRARLADRVPFVRTAVAHALGAVGDKAAVPDLMRIARMDSFDPARAAAAAASRLDERRVRTAAARPDAGPHLREAADLLEVTG